MDFSGDAKFISYYSADSLVIYDINRSKKHRVHNRVKILFKWEEERIEFFNSNSTGVVLPKKGRRSSVVCYSLDAGKLLYELPYPMYMHHSSSGIIVCNTDDHYLLFDDVTGNKIAEFEFEAVKRIELNVIRKEAFIETYSSAYRYDYIENKVIAQLPEYKSFAYHPNGSEFAYIKNDSLLCVRNYDGADSTYELNWGGPLEYCFQRDSIMHRSFATMHPLIYALDGKSIYVVGPFAAIQVMTGANQDIGPRAFLEQYGNNRYFSPYNTENLLLYNGLGYFNSIEKACHVFIDDAIKLRMVNRRGLLFMQGVSLTNFDLEAKTLFYDENSNARFFEPKRLSGIVARDLSQTGEFLLTKTQKGWDVKR
jgi:hypothetical protein